MGLVEAAALAFPQSDQEEPAELQAYMEDLVAGVSPSLQLGMSPLQEVDMVVACVLVLVVVMEEATVALVEV